MWNIHGVIPPVSDLDETSLERSPYEINSRDFVEKFSLSNERIDILKKFLYYRRFLYDLGVTSGFQWVNGSFTENIEVIKNRPPNDIDVVSFITEPENPLPEEFFDQNHIKQKYQVDGYFVDLNDSPQELIKWTTYWYSMWSHQRNTKIWKGFLQVPLSPQDDLEALNYLEGIKYA